MIQDLYINGVVFYPIINNEIVENTSKIQLTKHETLSFLNQTGLIIIANEHATPQHLAGATFVREIKFSFFYEALTPIFLDLVSIEKKKIINQIINQWHKENVDHIIFEFIHHYEPLSPRHIEMRENDSDYYTFIRTQKFTKILPSC